MAVVPIVRLFFPCAHIDENGGDGRVTIVDPIDSIFLPPGIQRNFVLGPIFFYAQVKEGLGTFYFRIEIKDERGRRLAKTKPPELMFSKRNHNAAEHLVFKLRDLRLERPGILQFDLFANEVILESWDLRVVALGE
jgi:hypothetical protein